MEIILSLVIGRFELYVLVGGLIAALIAQDHLANNTRKFLILGCTLGCLAVIANIVLTYLLIQGTIEMSPIEIAPIRILIQLSYAIAISLIIYASFAQEN